MTNVSDTIDRDECLYGRVFKAPQQNFSLVNETFVLFIKAGQEMLSNDTLVDWLENNTFFELLNSDSEIKVQINLQPGREYSLSLLGQVINILTDELLMNVFNVTTTSPVVQVNCSNTDDSYCNVSFGQDDRIRLELSEKVLALLGVNCSSTKHQSNVEPLFGLQNCYCNTCDPEKTVGKLFGGKCYFFSAKSEFRFNTITQNLSVEDLPYSVFADRYDSREDIAEQIVVETVLRKIKRSVKIALKMVNGSEISVGCLKVSHEKFAVVQCTRLMQTILVATAGNFTLRPIDVTSPYPECQFDQKAVKSSTDDKKCYKILNTSNCQLADIRDVGDLQNLQQYIANRSRSDPPTRKRNYRIKSADEKLEINRHFLIFSRVNTLRGEDMCMYINPYVKTIMYESCQKSTDSETKYNLDYSICEIFCSAANEMTNDDETSVLKLKRFAVYFLCSIAGISVALLIVTLILFGPLLKYWRPNRSQCGDVDDTTPIYRVRYTRKPKNQTKV